MLPKKYRLKGEKVEEVLKTGWRFKGNILNLYTKKKKTQGPSQIGIVVPQKVASKPTKRNRLKRQIREAVRKRLQEIRDNFQLLFMARKEIIGKTFKDIEKEIENLLQKARLKKSLIKKKKT
mgnify:CR=1 FL=1